MTRRRPDPIPFEAFMRDHAGPVLSYLRARAGADAEDCFQETFLAALRAYPRFDGANGRAWVMTIAHNKAIDRARVAGREQPVGDFEVVGLAGAVGVAAAQPAGGLTESQPAGSPTDLELTALVRSLADGQRDAILLRFAADMSFSQIGSALGCSEAAARRRTHDGLTRLRERYLGGGTGRLNESPTEEVSR